MGIPYRLHIACIYAYASTVDVKNLLTDAYMANMCNPYGKRICVHTIWASYDNAIGEDTPLIGKRTWKTNSAITK